MKKHVVFVIGSLEVGGAELQMEMLAVGLKQLGWRVDVFALDVSGPLRKRLESKGIVVFGGRPRPDSRSSRWVRMSLAWVALVIHLIVNRPRAVHALLPFTNFLGSTAARVAGIGRVVTSRRGLGNHQDRRPWAKFLDRTSNILSTVVTTNAAAIAADVQRRDGYPADRVIVVPNGLNLVPFQIAESVREEVRCELGLVEGNIGIVNVANLIAYKGHHDLLAAFAAVAHCFPTSRLFLIGQDRGELSSLSATVARLGLADKIVFLGARADVPRLLSAMDCGVMASHEEGLSNALIEKLATGMPVVATDVGGNSEVLRGMPNCRLVRPRDPDDLANGLVTTISVLPESREIIEFRRDAIRSRYASEAMVGRYESLYRGER